MTHEIVMITDTMTHPIKYAVMIVMTAAATTMKCVVLSSMFPPMGRVGNDPTTVRLKACCSTN